MPPRFSLLGHLAGILRQTFAAVPTLLRQPHLNGAYFGQGNQGSMMPRMSWLASRLSLALALAAGRSRQAGHAVRRRWFGGIGRILSPARQLSLQLYDLLFSVRNLLFAVRYFAAEFFVFLPQPLIFPAQCFPAGLVDVLLPIRRCPVWPENSIYLKQREIIPGVVDNEMIRCQSVVDPKN